MSSPLSKTTEYPDQVHAPALRRRHVFVKVAPGEICDPSGMVISRTNWAWSQTGVAEAAAGRVAAGSVGTDKAVFVATDNGSVGVLNGEEGTDGVNCAWTVSAAAVNTALGWVVGVAALDGKLHAESMKIKISRMERMRASLNM